MNVSKLFLFLLIPFSALAENGGKDTTNLLQTVTVNAYFSRQPVLSVPASVSVIGREQLQQQQPYSLLPALNTVPGVRMEERSPGSYRLSIRGSLLRSPYGIRNIKVYMDDFLLTDAGGNTYLGSIDAAGANNLEILKGPEASIFGANTGGVILLDPVKETKDSSLFNLDFTGGSFGLVHQNIFMQKDWKNFHLAATEASLRSDGYRANSALQRKYFHLTPRWNWSQKGELRALILYSDMNYRTPGGLTIGQFNENPRLARPAAGSIPGAAEQKAGIINKTTLAGILHEYRFSERLRNVTSVTLSHTSFKNPFITNYEIRGENSAGVRSYFELKNAQTAGITWKTQIGLEAQQTKSDISNYGNRGGTPDTLQAADVITANQKFFFLHLALNITRRLTMEAAGSLNFYNYSFRSPGVAEPPATLRKFNEQLMPRLAFSYTFSNLLALRASASRGYSPPTIAEVRASDNVINTSLQPENGWNYETGVRLSLFNNRIYYDGVLFHYSLKNAIVRRLNENGTEHFTNAGGTRQTGFESQLMGWIIVPRNRGFLRSLQATNSYTFSAFFFKNYQDAGNDYSGNRLTGVPKNTVVTSCILQFPQDLNLSIQHNYTSPIPLDDAGSAYAAAYHLLQAKAGWTLKQKNKYLLTVYAGADNLLNRKYSLGNDLNAFGGRFYNPAPARNFFAGVSATL